jgi:protease-4
MRLRCFAALLCLTGFFVSDADAQGNLYEEEPTGGLYLPSAGLAGQVDATTVTVNPAGIGLLEGPQLALAVALADEEDEVRSGPGGGLYYAASLGGVLFPRIGWGVALEWLRPARDKLSPDPGTPTRFTQSTSLPMGEGSALGLAWHHYFDKGGVLDALDTFDLGWTSRYGAHWAAGLVVRDLGAPSVGGTSVQRRYEAELVSRPMGSDRLEIGLGGRIGEKDVDFANGQSVDGWVKWSLRLARGIYMRGEVGTESLHQVATVTGTDEFLRDYRVSAGLELSFGGLGTSAYGTVVRDSDGENRASGGTFVARLSPRQVPSILPESKRIERLDLTGGIGQRRLTSIVAYLRRIGEDAKVVGLFVNLDSVAGGWATLHEVRSELVALRASGKKVFAFMVDGGTRQYYLASAADKVYVDPAGGIRLRGFSATSLYFAGLFKKLGVKAQFQRIEEYKRAPEQWTRTGPTEPAFRMRNDLYDGLYGTIVEDIASSRGISEQRVRTLIDNGPYTAGDLEKLPDLVDAIVVSDDLVPLIAKEMGRKYRYGAAPNLRAERWDRRKIAVIYIVGDIVGGSSRTVPLLGRSLVGGRTIAQALAAARADSEIEAIVLRINSPGGSALASEIMAREVKKARGVKPIICSMADYAASGGYYAAAYCDRIFADPMTVTGSIGIFNGSFDLSGLLTRMGLSWTTIKRGDHADLGSFYRPMSEKEQKFMKQKLHYFYGRFINSVAEGRSMTAEAVDDVGRGHVWTGKQGLGINLVDELGGIIDAIDYAKKMSNFRPGEKASLIMLPKIERSLLNKALGGSPFGSATDTETPASMKSLEPYIRLMGLLPGTMSDKLKELIPVSIWTEPSVPQARMPFSILWDE